MGWYGPKTVSERAGDERRFEPGECVVLRYITRDGRAGMSWPFRVVVDREDLVALHIPAGATYNRWRQRPVPGERRGVLEPVEWRREVLRLMFPGRGRSIWLFWSSHNGERTFATYYVNFEEPFRRTSIGFDTNDHTLDIVVAPDLTWHWKDEDDFSERVRTGIYSEELAELVRTEAEDVIEAIAGRKPPFSGEWEEWRPEPAWEVPVLPEGWEHVPVAQWALRTRAYGDAAGRPAR